MKIGGLLAFVFLLVIVSASSAAGNPFEPVDKGSYEERNGSTAMPHGHLIRGYGYDDIQYSSEEELHYHPRRYHSHRRSREYRRKGRCGRCSKFSTNSPCLHNSSYPMELIPAFGSDFYGGCVRPDVKETSNDGCPTVELSCHVFGGSSTVAMLNPVTRKLLVYEINLAALQLHCVDGLWLTEWNEIVSDVVCTYTSAQNFGAEYLLIAHQWALTRNEDTFYSAPIFFYNSVLSPTTAKAEIQEAPPTAPNLSAKLIRSKISSHLGSSENDYEEGHKSIKRRCSRCGKFTTRSPCPRSSNDTMQGYTTLADDFGGCVKPDVHHEYDEDGCPALKVSCHVRGGDALMTLFDPFTRTFLAREIGQAKISLKCSDGSWQTPFETRVTDVYCIYTSFTDFGYASSSLAAHQWALTRDMNNIRIAWPNLLSPTTPKAHLELNNEVAPQAPVIQNAHASPKTIRSHRISGRGHKYDWKTDRRSEHQYKDYSYKSSCRKFISSSACVRNSSSTAPLELLPGQVDEYAGCVKPIVRELRDYTVEVSCHTHGVPAVITMLDPVTMLVREYTIAVLRLRCVDGEWLSAWNMTVVDVVCNYLAYRDLGLASVIEMHTWALTRDPNNEILVDETYLSPKVVKPNIQN